MWEHERNKNGGRLVILFKRNSNKDSYQREVKVLEDKLWLEMVSVSDNRSDLTESIYRYSRTVS